MVAVVSFFNDDHLDRVKYNIKLDKIITISYYFFLLVYVLLFEHHLSY